MENPRGSHSSWLTTLCHRHRWTPASVRRGLSSFYAQEANHEKRATLFCLLTAALASKGTAAIIGEDEGGWFWLPPWSLWQSWATEGLESAAKRMALKVTSVLDAFTVGL